MYGTYDKHIRLTRKRTLIPHLLDNQFFRNISEPYYICSFRQIADIYLHLLLSCPCFRSFHSSASYIEYLHSLTFMQRLELQNDEIFRRIGIKYECFFIYRCIVQRHHYHKRQHYCTVATIYRLQVLRICSGFTFVEAKVRISLTPVDYRQNSDLVRRINSKVERYCTVATVCTFHGSRIYSCLACVETVLRVNRTFAHGCRECRR